MEQQFGEKESAFHTMDLYTSAVLEATLAPFKEPPQVSLQGSLLAGAVACGRSMLG